MAEQQPLLKIQATLYARVNDMEEADRYIQGNALDQFHLLSLNDETQTTVEIVRDVPDDVIVSVWTREESPDG